MRDDPRMKADELFKDTAEETDEIPKNTKYIIRKWLPCQ